MTTTRTIDDAAADEGMAMLQSKSFQLERPNGGRSRSRGHGIDRTSDPGAKLRDKKEPEPEKPLACPPVPVPDFLASMLRCDYLAKRSKG